jgi:hypothetical protein
VSADHQCLARFAEFFAIVSASLRLHLHLAEDASAAPGGGKLDRSHHAFIIEKGDCGGQLDCRAGVSHRETGRQFACSLPRAGLTMKLAGDREIHADILPAATFLWLYS